jgi:prepilin-type N-terminal cleavage/methylation domain-containing protein
MKIISRKKNTQTGFTVIEFIVVATIFAIMSTVATVNYGAHQRRLEQTNVAQDIALTIRQAQLYGISAGKSDFIDDFNDEEDIEDYFENADIGDDPSSRGVSVDPEAKSITLFNDINNNGVYNAGTDTVIDVRAIVSDRISEISICSGDSSTSCTAIGAGNLDIVFTRPFPDATIDDGESFGQITIKADGQNDKYVQINAFGGIVVK